MVNHAAPIIYKVCYMYASDTTPVADLYQEVLANLWQGFSSFRAESSPATWIYRVAINTCITFFRRNSRQSVIDRIEDTPDTSLSDADSAAHSELLAHLHSLIGMLPPLDKAIIMLWLDEYSYDDIAALTGLSHSNVATRLHRIRQRLSDQFNDSHSTQS